MTPNPPCDICGSPSTMSDGMVRAYLCDQPECLDRAWDLAFVEGWAEDQWCCRSCHDIAIGVSWPQGHANDCTCRRCYIAAMGGGR